MSKILIDEATAKQVLAVLEGVWKGGFSFPTLDRIRQAITALREALAEQPAQQEPVAWPCLIAEADFSANTVTLAMQCTDYKFSAGEHWLSNTPPALQSLKQTNQKQVHS